MRVALFSFCRKYGWFVLLMLAAACSSPPPDPAIEALHKPAQPAVSRIVVLYPALVFSGSDGMVQIRWNDMQSCDLESGSYLIREVVPGDELINFSFCGFSSTSRIHIKTAEGQTYYLRILPYDSSFRGMVSGYPSEFPPFGTPPHKGPFKVDLISEDEAFKELAALKSQPTLKQ